MESSSASPVRSSALGSQISDILVRLQSRQGQEAVSPDRDNVIRHDMKSNAVVLLMGVTGAGKSSFIQRVTGNEDVLVGHSLQSMTAEVSMFPFETTNCKFMLVDTPGFNDTWLTDRDVLDDIAEWLSTSYKQGFRISGAIYLHRITDTRMEGSALRSLRVFRKLCGEDFLKNVLLATTHWDQVDEEVGAKREAELMEKDGFFKDMVQAGCQVVRIANDSAQNIDLLTRFVGRRLSVMQIQQELIDGKAVSECNAAAEISQELAELQKINSQKLADIQHIARKSDTKLSLEMFYAMKWNRRGFEEQEAALKADQEIARREGEEQIQAQTERLEALQQKQESQTQIFRMKMDDLNKKLTQIKMKGQS